MNFLKSLQDFCSEFLRFFLATITMLPPLLGSSLGKRLIRSLFNGCLSVPLWRVEASISLWKIPGSQYEQNNRRTFQSQEIICCASSHGTRGIGGIGHQRHFLFSTFTTLRSIPLARPVLSYTWQPGTLNNPFLYSRFL